MRCFIRINIKACEKLQTNQIDLMQTRCKLGVQITLINNIAYCYIASAETKRD